MTRLCQTRSIAAVGLAALLPLVLAGCSASLPNASEALEGTGQAQSAAKAGVEGTAANPGSAAPQRQTAGAAQASPPAAGAGAPVTAAPEGLITGLRASTVILYMSETGHDGARVLASSLSLPMRPSRRSADGTRLEIATVGGPRWLAVSEIAGDVAASPRSSATAARPPSPVR